MIFKAMKLLDVDVKSFVNEFFKKLMCCVDFFCW